MGACTDDPGEEAAPPPSRTEVSGGAVTGAAAGAQPSESFAEYYRKLGVAEPVVTCYVSALVELGVTSLDQLESDQEMAARGADQFDRCVAEFGTGAGAGGLPATTPTA